MSIPELIRPAMVFDFVSREEKDWLPEWFKNHYLGVFHLLSSQEDLRSARSLAISMLTDAWDFRIFREDNPEADELDRAYLICWLQYLTSRTGLLTYDEIKQIQESEGESFPPLYLEDKPLLGFREVVEKTRRWQKEEEIIGLIHGSFDPPTLAHLDDIFFATQCCHRLLIGFDSDELLRLRKGLDRPRYPLGLRRQILEDSWMVDLTVVMRPNEIDCALYQEDYQALHIDRLFTVPEDPALEEKKRRIESLGGELIAMPKYFGDFHSTGLMRILEERKKWLYGL